MFKGTLKELAVKLNTDYLVLQGLVKYLETKKLATQVGKKTIEGQKGRASIIWEINGPVSILEELK